MPSEMLKQLDLSQGTLGQDLLTEDIGNLLDSNALTCLSIRGGTIPFTTVSPHVQVYRLPVQIAMLLAMRRQQTAPDSALPKDTYQTIP